MRNLNRDMGKAVNPIKIKSEYERFQYIFPLYRMNILVFDHKMSQLGMATYHSNGERKSDVVNSKLVNLDHFRKVFCTTPSWRKLWPNLEALFKTPYLKDIVNQISNENTDDIDPTNLISKIEIGVLALLWC